MRVHGFDRCEDSGQKVPVHAVVQDVRAVLPQLVAAMAHEILKRESTSASARSWSQSWS